MPALIAAILKKDVTEAYQLLEAAQKHVGKLKADGYKQMFPKRSEQ